MQLSAMQVGASSFRGVQLQAATLTSRAQCRVTVDIRAMKDVQGTVISVQMNKTAVVQVERYVPHRLYGKRVRRTRKFFAHDEHEEAEVGDVVRIVSTPPISKRKSFKLDKILSKEGI